MGRSCGIERRVVDWFDVKGTQVSSERSRGSLREALEICEVNDDHAAAFGH